MRAETIKLLAKVNAKKEEVRKLVNEDKVKEAKSAKEELINLQEKLNIQLDLDEDYSNNKKDEILEQLNKKDNNYKDLTRRTIKNAIYPGESLIKNQYENKDNIDLAKLVRGMSGQGWENAYKEKEYFNAMSTGGNKVLIPQKLADSILDVAREQSALFGSIPVIPMDSNNITIAVQKKDGEANFVNENELIPSSEAIFEGVELDGKTLAMFIPISEKLLETASNISEQLITSCSKAIANALDRALIYGKGKEVEEGQSEEIKGLIQYDINKFSTNLIDYDVVLKAIKPIKKSNLKATNVCYNTDLSMDLQMLKTSDGQYLLPPTFLNDFNISESNNLKDSQVLVYDNEALLMGIGKNITLEWGYTGDQFQRLQRGLRVHLRADMGVVRPKGITLATIE